MLKKVYFENFKSFDKAELTIDMITPLIGTNASGKTNAIEGMMILSEIVSGLDLSVILDGTRNGILKIRGGAKGCCRLNSGYFVLGCTVGHSEDTDLEYRIKISVSDRIMVDEESLCLRSSSDKDYSKSMFSTKSPERSSGNIFASCNNGQKGRNPDIMCIRFASVISQIATKLPQDRQYAKAIVEYSNHIINTLRNILFLNPETSNMRGYAAVNDKALKMNAENISSVLYNLCNDKNNKDKLLDMMKALPENEILNIEFMHGPLSDVILALEEQVGGSREKIEAKRLSDGTLRCLAIIAAIMSEEQGGMLVVEEIDNGIHPGRSEKLINLISEAAQERKVDVLFTTHNAVLLNALKKDELESVQIVYRDKESGEGKIISLLNVERVPELLAGGSLGDVFSNGKILDYVKDNRKIDSNYSWLETM